jgi:hypothetical protein
VRRWRARRNADREPESPGDPGQSQPLLVSLTASAVHLLAGSWLPFGAGVLAGIWWLWPEWKLRRAIAKAGSAAARRGDMKTMSTARRELGRMRRFRGPRSWR